MKLEGKERGNKRPLYSAVSLLLTLTIPACHLTLISNLGVILKHFLVVHTPPSPLPTQHEARQILQ